MKLFLDTSFIVSYTVTKDKHYDKACLLDEQGIFDNNCFINNLVANEIVTVIGNKTKDVELAINTYETVKDNCTIINEFNTVNFKEKVLAIYKEYNTVLSFTDSSIIEVMKENNIKKLVSFDTFFDNVESIERIY